MYEKFCEKYKEKLDEEHNEISERLKEAETKYDEILKKKEEEEDKKNQLLQELSEKIAKTIPIIINFLLFFSLFSLSSCNN